MTLVRRAGLVFIILGSTVSCKSTSGGNGSDVKALANPLEEGLAPEDWIEGCEVEVKGAEGREQLRQLAQTDDCTKAYPIVKEIFQKFAQAGRKR